jgi:hypothetical protein
MGVQFIKVARMDGGSGTVIGLVVTWLAAMMGDRSGGMGGLRRSQPGECDDVGLATQQGILARIRFPNTDWLS